MSQVQLLCSDGKKLSHLCLFRDILQKQERQEMELHGITSSFISFATDKIS